MENENKKKSSSFKTVCAVLGCVVMAVVYISGGIYAVERLKETEFYQEAVAKTKLLQEQGANSEEAKANNAKAEESKPEDSFGKDALEKPQQDDDAVSAFAQQEQEEQIEHQKPALPYTQPSAGANVNVANADLISSAEYGNVVVSDVSEVVKAVMPCVVAITNEYTAYDYWYDQMIDEEANGSGIIVGQTEEELLIVTNYHVVEDSKELYVQLAVRRLGRLRLQY